MITMEPIVKRPYYHFENPNRVDKEKGGRGFSLGELSKAGLTRREAELLSLPVDLRRRSVYENNVEALKKAKEQGRETLEKAKTKKMNKNKKRAEKKATQKA